MAKQNVRPETVKSAASPPAGGAAFRQAGAGNITLVPAEPVASNTTDPEIQRPAVPGYPNSPDSRDGSSDLRNAEHGTR
jgi:hypothetical protein